MIKSKLFPLVGLNIFLGLLFVMGNAYALGDATHYYVTIQEIALKQVGGAWVTIASPNQEIDICNVSVGQAAATIGASLKIPAGEYDNFKVKVSSTMRFEGADGLNYTKDGGTITMEGGHVDGSAASTATWAGSTPGLDVEPGAQSGTYTTNVLEQGVVTINLNLHPGDTDGYMEVYGSSNLATPISVKEDSAISMWFDFDTKNTVGYTVAPGPVDIMYLLPPKSGTEYSITVDGVTTSISANDMQIDF